MINEEKQLLLIDLCGRLPYNLWVRYEDKNYLVTGYGHGRVSLLPNIFSSATGPCPLVEEVMPYLRPMSSMTNKERRFLLKFGSVGMDENDKVFDVYPFGLERTMSVIDFLNTYHFDYRGLISMGLALEAPEGMYKED